MSFAAGFYGRVADNMADKKQFIRNRVEEDRTYLRQQGLQRQAAVAEQKGRYQMATEQLLRIQGVDRNTVLAALEADPDGIVDLAGRDYTNGATINTVLEIYKDTDPTSTNLTDILNSVMPAVSALPADADPTTVRRKGLAAWLGLDTETELNEQVYSAQIVGGMTGDQILASMNVPVRGRGTGSRGMNYEAVEDPLTAAQKQSYFNDIVPEYDTLLEEKIKTVQQDRTLSPEDKMKEVERLRALGVGPVDTRLTKLLEEFGPTENSQAFFDAKGTNLFGPGMARFFSATETDNPENTQDPNAITTTELPEAGTAELPKIEVTNEEEAIQKGNAFWLDPANDGVNEMVLVIDGEDVPITRPFTDGDYATEGTRMITVDGKAVREEYTVRTSPVVDAETIIQDSTKSNAEKAQELALIQKYLLSLDQTPDVTSDLEFIQPYIKNFLEG